MRGTPGTRLIALLLATALQSYAGAVCAQTHDASDPAATAQSNDEGPTTPPAWLIPFARDVGAYYTSPFHWDGRDWVWFGGVVAVTAGAHHFDTDVRTHFARRLANGGIGGKSYELQDFLPSIAVIAGTGLGAAFWDEPAGFREAGTMVEAGVLSSATAYAVKYAAGRAAPNQTTDPNRWRVGGSSFPSTHSAAAFAVGAVLAESGNDEYRWLRRFLGYGMAGFTVYERLKHNDHWLSDTVAGAALGASTARFVMHRRYPEDNEGPLSSISVAPTSDGGVMLTYTRYAR